MKKAMDNLFMNVISSSFQNIKDSFSIRIKRIGLSFNEDIFSDTLIKCNDKLLNENMGYKEMIAYFWTSFKINTLRELNYSRNKNVSNIFPTNIAYEYEEANDSFDRVSKIIINRFGEEWYRLFVLHSNGATYEELYEITECKNLKYTFRKIREYVRTSYKQE